MSAAIFGTDVTHGGRGVQMAVVMSSTRSAAPFTGISTATAAGMVGTVTAGLAVAGAAVTAAVGWAVAVAVGAADGTAGGGAHAANKNARTSVADRRRDTAGSPDPDGRKRYAAVIPLDQFREPFGKAGERLVSDRKSTRLNSSH